MFKVIAKFFSRSDSDAAPTNSVQEQEAPREQSSLPSPRSHLEANRELAGELHNAILERLVAQHSRVLRKKIKRHLRQDEYGQEIGFNEAGDELAYFLSHVAKADGDYRGARKKIIELDILHLLFDKNPADFNLDRLAADIGEKFDLNLIGYVYILATRETEDDPANDKELNSLSGEDFELCCEDRLRSLGWSVHRKGGVGDQGVDLIASKHGSVVAVQCKRHASAVGNQAIQQVEAGRQFEEADFATVVSNNSYTPSAQHLASKLGVVLLHYSELDLLAQRLGIK